MPAPSQLNDEIDFTVVKFGTECCLRGHIGRYITVVPTSSTVVNKGGSEPTMVYALGVKGQGISEPLDELVLVNVEQREDQGAIRYGMTVAVRAPAAKERFLGVRGSVGEPAKLGFFRNLIGQGEKWIILKGLPSTIGASSNYRTSEDVNARGEYVRVGDLVILQTSSSDQLLCVHEGGLGADGRLMQKGSGGLGAELWQLELFRSPPMPLWMNRPYLRYHITLYVFLYQTFIKYIRTHVYINIVATFSYSLLANALLLQRPNLAPSQAIVPPAS